ncbi:Endophilin-B1-like [Oopsacas minuta]|uniref:Endophilin-B1-like n=1 Tax=Oopsacas minuta TaxID=111878 RepID=A0AAV7JTN2_9METZ|nr:Endophilin-B1-like [Oopsacas minuta]
MASESSMSTSVEQGNSSNGTSKMGQVRRAYSRTRQFTLEKFGKGEVTEYGPEYTRLCTKVDKIRSYTERISMEVSYLLQPNPTLRMEEFLMKRMSPTHGINLPHLALGDSLLSYGKTQEGMLGAYLSNCGTAHKGIGESRRKFMEETNAYLLTPLRAFLDVDLRAANNERKRLGILRLDLDAAKSEYRKCTKTEKLKQLEERMAIEDEAYSEQYQKTVDCYKRIVEVHERHLGYFKKYIASYSKYMQESVIFLDGITTTPQVTESDEKLDNTSGGKQDGIFTIGSEPRKAKAKFDYTANSDEEIPILKDEVVMVTQENDAGFATIEKINGETGKVPTAYLEFL